MKRILLSFATIIFALIVVASSDTANVVMFTKVIRGKNDVYRIIIPHQNFDDMKITIRNPKGNILQQKLIKNNTGFMLPINLSGAKYGDYTVEFATKGYHHIETLHHEAAQQLSVVPVGNGKYKVLIDSHTPDEYYITVRDSKDQLVHVDRFTEGKSCARIYDLNNLESSVFTFSLKSYTVSSDIEIVK